MPNPKKEIRDFRNMTVNFEEAAKFLNLSKSSFYRLIETGVIPKAGEGEYILGEVVESYWRNQFDAEGLKAAQTRLTTAQAELKELELAEQRGEMHRASAIRKIWSENVFNTRAKLLMIPQKMPPLLVGRDEETIRRRLLDEINDALKELADYDAGRITRAALLADK